ncbi:hypothetical protein [Neisseria weaveri]|uniref:hypothetical protein n=1 Tax=Neisseria weaveri TaxID=28091 RepID=UPI0007C9DBFE|nr:hypothetical protein [Neisseria weaveri]SAY51258.1 Uncharacterised protein [Neisseria weaveri]
MKTMKIILSCFTLAILVSACGSPRQLQPYRYWFKEGVSQQATADQIGHCRHEVRASDLSGEHAKKLVGYCMQAKGYTLMTGYR